MRKILMIFTAIIISLAIASCSEKLEDPYQDYVPPVTTTEKVTASDELPVETEEEIEEISYVTMLPAIIDNLKKPLTSAKSEYDDFVKAIDLVKDYLSNPTDDKLSAAMKTCNNLSFSLSGAPDIVNKLTPQENEAILNLGMLDESYKNVFNMCGTMRNMKISVLNGVTTALENLEAFGYDLNVVVEFYSNYTKLFQMNLYYNINVIINECTAESESITDFKTTFYPDLIERFSDSMKWEDDNELLVELCDKVQTDIETTIKDFQEKTNITGDEEEEIE